MVSYRGHAMSDGTLAGLRMHEVQTYWDANRTQPAGKLQFNRCAQSWHLGGNEMREDLLESTQSTLVLRA